MPVPESAKNTAIAEKREENPEILTKLMRKRLTRWGRSNLVDPMEWPKIGLPNRWLGRICGFSSSKKKKNRQN